MTQNSDKRLIFSAAHLAHRAPHEWADFLSAFTAYVDTKRDECICSPVDMLQVTQGRAQACNSLRDLFAECVQTANKIDQQQNLKSSRPRQPL